MRTLIDASSAIYAWRNYPINIFPKLWAWIAQETNGKRIQCIADILAEIQAEAPNCHQWLVKNKITNVIVDNEISKSFESIKINLGIGAFGLRSKGVGGNDILLIATALITDSNLITNESIQNEAPRKRNNYKIPLVCKVQNPPVNSFPFIDFIISSGRTF